MDKFLNGKDTSPRLLSLQLSHVAAYRFIEKYIQKNIVAPEMEEIAKGIKLTVRQTYRVVGELCELHYISKQKYKTRSIKIVKPLQ